MVEASITLLEEWFTDSRLTTNGSVSVDIRFLNSFQPPMSIGVVTLARQPIISVTTNVAAVVPLGIAFHNDLLVVPVYAHVVYSVATFSVLCNVSDGMRFEIDHLEIGSKWNYEVRQQFLTDISIVAMLSDPSTATDNPVSAEILFNLALRVMPNATPSQKQNFSCSVLYISHVLNEKVQLRNEATPQPATIYDYFNNDPFIGEIQIEQSQPVTVFPYAAQSQLINTAYFTGMEVSTPVMLLVAFESGSIISTIADNCTSLANSLSVEESCGNVILTGSETHGDESAVVVLSFQGLSTNITFRIWFPTSSASLVSTPTILSAVEGWINEDMSVGGCTQQYQRGKLSAFANFSFSDVSPHYEVDILGLIQSQLVSSNDSVVRIENGGILIGLQPGECEITAGINVALLRINVSSSVVTISSFNVLLTTGLSLMLPTSPYEALSVLPASAFLLQDFNVDRALV